MGRLEKLLEQVGLKEAEVRLSTPPTASPSSCKMLGVVPAGCRGWHPDMVAAHSDVLLAMLTGCDERAP